MRSYRRIISAALLACMFLELGGLQTYASETAATQVTTEAAATEQTETSLPAETTDAAETTEVTEATEATEPAESTEATVPGEEPAQPPGNGEDLEDPALKSSQSASMSFDASGYTDEPVQVPLYLQTDYPNVPYGSGTLATSGCTMTCVAMVATYLSGEACMPDTLAKQFKKYDASHLQRLEAASTVRDLVYTKTTRWEDVEEALAGGKVVIILLGKPSKFTNSQHTVVLTGITQEGKILVNDPYGPNYKKWELKDGFAHGFDPDMLKTGFGQAWIYEGYEPTDTSVSRYSDLKLSQEDKDLIASVIWLEARGEPFEGQQAIAEIILNRRASGEFGDNIEWIIRAEGQFRTAKFLDDAEPGALQYKAIEKALYGPNVLPMGVYFFGRKATNKNVWGKIGGHIFCYGW